MLPFDEIDSLLSPAQREAFAAQNDITAQMAGTIALYVYLASTGEYRAAEAIEAEFNRFYNRRMAEFINAAPNIAAETVINYSRESYEAMATPTMPTFEQNAPIYRTAVINAEQAQRIVGIIAPGNTGITEQLPDGMRFTSTQSFFSRELNDGAQNVIAGNKTYTEVIRDVVHKMANSGIRTMTTPPTENLPNGRTERIDVITRRAILTGIKDAITDNAYEMARQMGTTFFEISLHDGARETHWWGGYRFSVVPTDVIDLQTGKPFVTDEYLREASGGWITDWNCRHFITPVDSAERPLYTLDDIQAHKDAERRYTKYKGDRYTRYEATQRMRAMEREMRALRQEGMLHKTAYQTLREQGVTAKELTEQGDPYTEARLKYRMLRSEYAEFAEAFNMRVQYERVAYDMLGRVF